MDVEPSREHLTSPQAEALARWLRDEGGDEANAAGPFPQIKGFQVHALIGEGATSRVYLATREDSDRRLALKVFKHRVGAGALAEAERQEQLRLPCVPEVADFGRATDGTFYIACAFVDGRHATRWADERRLDVRGRVELLVRICRAVAELHERAVIHRDLKPANILINEHGDVVLVDLGLGWSPPETGSGTPEHTGGTPTFAAPEQWAGAAPTTRMDVHALGAMGRALLRGVSLPTPLAAVLDKAAAEDPNARYPSARELGEDLERWLRREPVEALPAGRVRRVTRWIGRHPVWATAVACVGMVVATVAGTGVVTWWWAFQPYTLDYSVTDRTLAVLARSGTALRGVSGAEHLVKLRGKHGPARRLAMVHEPVGGLPRAGIYAWSDLEQPLLSFYDLDFEQPPAPPEVDHHDDPARLDRPYEIYALAAGDVFGNDGLDEALVSIRRGEHSASAILVVDQQGRVLASLWHDGQIDAVGWSESAGLIVGAGVNSEVHAHERVGARWEGYEGDPLVAFGVEVERGVHGWINTTSMSGTLEPAFYECLLPLDTAQWLRVEQIAIDRAGMGRVSFFPYRKFAEDPLQASVLFKLELSGVGSLASVGDAYPDSLPDPRTFSWADLPPRKPGVKAGGRELGRP
ncbi:MAG: serine/threonine protein kinase [Phycisphaerales bacterium JB060]